MEGIGLAFVACYLAVFLGVVLPDNTVFLGEVAASGDVTFNGLVTWRMLEICTREGWGRVVGLKEVIDRVHSYVAVHPEYERKVEFIPLKTGTDLIPLFFKDCPSTHPWNAAG